jgi:hypothetical protein
MKELKVVRLCKEGSCCPEVRVERDKVTIGEDKNICTLTREQWDILKEKIVNKEI